MPFFNPILCAAIALALSASAAFSAQPAAPAPPKPAALVEADKLFDKKQWAAAERAYEAFARGASGKEKFEAQYRAAVCMEFRKENSRAITCLNQIAINAGALRDAPEIVAKAHERLYNIYLPQKNSTPQRERLVSECARLLPGHAVSAKLCEAEAEFWLAKANPQKAAGYYKLDGGAVSESAKLALARAEILASKTNDFPSAELISAVFQQAHGAKHPTIENISAEIKKLEIGYTWHWLQQAINAQVLEPADQSIFRCISDFGPHHDDAMSISWEWNSLDITVVDTRLLFVVADMQNREKWDIESTFKEIVNWLLRSTQHDAEIHIETLSANQDVSIGKIISNRANPRAWFMNPIMWVVKDKQICFMFDKKRRPPVSKIPYKDAPRWVGGIPLSDPRKWLRFETSNRVELSHEYFQPVLQIEKDEVKVKEIDPRSIKGWEKRPTVEQQEVYERFIKNNSENKKQETDEWSQGQTRK